MTAATITTAPDGVLEPEHRVLTLSDGETYVAQMSNPIMAKLTQAETTASWAGSAVNLSYALSGSTFTITYKVAGSAVTDKLVSISVYGRK